MSASDTATYYMVEMDYPHETAAQRETFDAYYWRHIDMLLTIPGFMTAQRFHCAETEQAPFLALYRLAGPQVLTSDAYTSKAGRMSVHPDFRACISDWDRNLVQGPTGSGGPDLSTAMADKLVLIDRLTPDSPPLPDGTVPLEVIGLDSTIVQRGVVEDGSAGLPQSAEGWSVRVWHPIHALRRPD
jgi:hypothetical protein